MLLFARPDCRQHGLFDAKTGDRVGFADLSDFSILVVSHSHSKAHPITTALGSMQAAPLLRVHLLVCQEDVMRQRLFRAGIDQHDAGTDRNAIRPLLH